jgi:hypothetical protein
MIAKSFVVMLHIELSFHREFRSDMGTPKVPMLTLQRTGG